MEKSLKTKTKVYLERASTTYEGGQLFSLSLNSFAHDLNLGIFLGLVKLESKQQEVYKYERNKLSISLPSKSHQEPSKNNVYYCLHSFSHTT